MQTLQAIEHGHYRLLHDAVLSQIDGLKRAEVHLLVGSSEPWPLGACGTHCTVEEELRTRIPHQAFPCKSKSVLTLNDSTGFVVGVVCQ
jgi:hypothetical protein